MSIASDCYPLAEKSPHTVLTHTGKKLSDVTVEAVLSGQITPADLAITPEILMRQAEIARSVQKDRLAINFERGADLVGVPEKLVMETYEMLRPGRAKSVKTLKEHAEMLRTKYKANRIAELIDEAAEIYEARGILSKRY